MPRGIILALFLLLLSGCDMNCIFPGEGVSANLTNTSVPVYLNGMDPKDPSTLWVDPGITIKEHEEVQLTIAGDIDLCGKLFNREKFEMCPEWNCKIIEVSNKFCSDGDAPPGIYDPSNLSNIQNKEPLCPTSSTTSKGRYVDTYINLLPGDRILFELMPVASADVIDCNNIPVGFTWYNKRDFINSSSGKPIKLLSGENADPLDICKSGGQLIVPRDFKDLDVILPPPTGEASFNSVLVGNGYTPRSNRVIVGSGKFRWINGADVDMRIFVPSIASNGAFCRSAFSGEMKPEDAKQQKTIHWEYAQKAACERPKGNDELRRFETYKVNSMCGNLGFQRSYSVGFYSVRYDEIFDEPCFRGRKKNKAGLDMAWADLLVAKIGSSEKDRATLLKDNDPAQACIFSLGNEESALSTSVRSCMDVNAYGGRVPSLELNRWISIPESEGSGGPLLLGIASTKSLSDRQVYSGYRVRVKKECSYQDGKNLYVYIGDTPPPVAPGVSHAQVHELHFSANAIKRAVINPQEIDPSTYSLSFSGKGKVYFGIANAVNSSVVQAVKTGKYLSMEENRYTVGIVQEHWYPNFSEPFNIIYQAIVKLFYGKNKSDSFVTDRSDGLIVQIYNLVSRKLAPVIQAAMVLYLVTYGLSFLLGMIRDPRSDVVMRVAKIAFILLLVSDQSWQFFGETIFNLFVNSSNELIRYFTSNMSHSYESDNAFEFLDRTVGVVITNQFWLRMLALFLSGPVGWLVMAIILWGVFLFFSCIIEAMVVYLMILIATGLLFLLAPLFISFLLFQRTKPLFEGWLKMLISFALRPIFIFGTLSLLNAIMMATLYGINNFGVCPGCVISTDIFGSDLCIIPTLVPVGFEAQMDIADRFVTLQSSSSGFMGLPVSLVSVIVFLLVAHSMKSFLKITDSMVDMITSTMMGYTGGTGGGSPSDAGHAAYQAMLSVVGMDDATQSEISQAIKARARSRRSSILEAVESNASASGENTEKTRDSVAQLTAVDQKELDDKVTGSGSANTQEPINALPQGDIIRSRSPTDPLPALPGEEGDTVRSRSPTDPLPALPGEEGDTVRSRSATDPLPALPGEEGNVVRPRSATDPLPELPGMGRSDGTTDTQLNVTEEGEPIYGTIEELGLGDSHSLADHNENPEEGENINSPIDGASDDGAGAHTSTEDKNENRDDGNE